MAQEYQEPIKSGLGEFDPSTWRLSPGRKWRTTIHPDLILTETLRNEPGKTADIHDMYEGQTVLNPTPGELCNLSGNDGQKWTLQFNEILPFLRRDHPHLKLTPETESLWAREDLIAEIYASYDLDERDYEKRNIDTCLRNGLRELFTEMLNAVVDKRIEEKKTSMF